jgi:hypothetical protein
MIAARAGPARRITQRARAITGGLASRAQADAVKADATSIALNFPI